ncbi:MAG: hypothetical protein HETSPECPRED_003008 [Heterodermia speciosa]|uniref:Uncharacterized protein n=1 Tax=Heterodermia speciosa TaxID=116794 RepID=A0A8H3F044_9LECA|nr:MAG: hypothetical protein HETSPECPRED_003008 [Heterodermia speciosa]
MDWFIKKGETVEENKPKRLEYWHDPLCSTGVPSKITAPVYVHSDVHNSGAPELKTNEVVELVRVTADLRRIPTHNFPTTFGKDGLLYYDLKFEIEITYYSAYTKYELIYDGKNYGPVSAEYV